MLPAFNDYFGQAYKLATGQTHTEFRYVQGVTPMSTWTEVLVAVAIYLVVIFGGQELMRNRSPMQPKLIFQIHNVFLTVASLVLLVLFLEQVVPMVFQNGFFFAICHADAWTQKLEFLYYLNYLLKYYELLDTVFLVVKKKKLDFLHWFHHSMTAVLCFVQLNGYTSVSWVVITLNLAVHVLMYWFYLLTSMGKRPWWKQWVTTAQITQFVIDLCVIYYCAYTLIAFRFLPWLPHQGTCVGTDDAAIFGVALLTSYLFLFLDFWRRTYNKPKAAAVAKKTE
ncbi:GNS1/SUR4 membrane protein [Ramicandelaber brevisporus]|nr:GNS1/SUR4 membrane protein [Ramicandelaber brevisporus]